jgi:hypothetical protein
MRATKYESRYEQKPESLPKANLLEVEHFRHGDIPEPLKKPDHQEK